MSDFRIQRPLPGLPAPISTEQVGQPSTKPAIPFPGLPTVPLLPAPKGPSELKPLSGEQLKAVAGVGGVGIQGTGELSGTIAIESRRVVNFGIATQADVPVLVTANRGAPNQVSFELDMDVAKARAAAGQDVTVSGTITKNTDTVGRIAKASIEGTDGFPFGGYHAFSGRVEERTPMGIGGEAPPSGNYLVLDTPIKVAGEDHRAVYLGHANVKPGDVVELTGRLDKIEHGRVTNLGAYVVGLSGVTNQSAGEPKYDGEKFTDSQGKELKRFSYDRPMMYDAPAQLYVVDQGADKVWVGGHGGMLPPGMNPFHGFSGSAAIETPTQADRDRIGSDAQGKPYDKVTNQKFDELSTVGQGPGVADGMSTSWYRNPENGTLYRVLNGGFAGFQNHLDQIVRP